MTTLEPPVGKEPWKRVRKRKGKPSRYDLIEDSIRDTQPMTVRCIHCPDWRAEGPAGQVRQEAAKHRKQKHRRRRRK